MLRMLGWIFFDDRLILNRFVLLAESNVSIGMQFGHVLREIVHLNGLTNFTANFDGCFPIDQRWCGTLRWRIVQVVVCRMETFSVEKGEKRKFKIRINRAIAPGAFGMDRILRRNMFLKSKHALSSWQNANEKCVRRAARTASFRLTLNTYAILIDDLRPRSTKS